jgi:hypothetical protein
MIKEFHNYNSSTLNLPPRNQKKWKEKSKTLNREEKKKL